jgi:hypothetical protein
MYRLGEDLSQFRFWTEEDAVGAGIRARGLYRFWLGRIVVMFIFIIIAQKN